MFWKLRLRQIWDGIKLVFGPLLNKPRNVKLIINEKTINLLGSTEGATDIFEGERTKDYEELAKLGKEKEPV